MTNKISFVFILVYFFSNSQSHNLGIQGGMSRYNITSNIKSEIWKNEAQNGITTGVSYNYILNNGFSFGTDILFIQRGFNNVNYFQDNMGNKLDESFIINYRHNYIALPIKAGFELKTKLYGFAFLGVLPSFLTQANITLPTFDFFGNLDGRTETIDITKQIHNFDFGGFAEIGGGYRIKDRILFYTSLMFQRSFTSFSKSIYSSNFTSKHIGFIVNFGLKFRFNKS